MVGVVLECKITLPQIKQSERQRIEGKLKVRLQEISDQLTQEVTDMLTPHFNVVGVPERQAV